MVTKLNDVTIIKDYTNYTNEELFDIVPQLEAQCPVVDGMIKDADYMVNDINSTLRYHDEDAGYLIEQLEDVRTYISNLEDDFEKFRDTIIEIRAWGQEWKNLALYLMESMEVEDVINLTTLSDSEKERVTNSIMEHSAWVK